jgi:hypothetical protein
VIIFLPLFLIFLKWGNSSLLDRYRNSCSNWGHRVYMPVLKKKIPECQSGRMVDYKKEFFLRFTLQNSHLIFNVNVNCQRTPLKCTGLGW